MRYIFTAFVCLLLTTPVQAQEAHSSQYHDFRLDRITGGLDHPWGMAFLPNGNDVLITERSGQLRLLRNGNLLPQAIQGLPEIEVAGQGGLLDVVLHPDFENNRLVYLSYAEAENGKANTAVGRGTLNGLRLENFEVIFRAAPKTARGRNHYGSRLLFSPEGYLYITLGDRYHFMEEAQNPENHLGAVVRILPDGSVPEDNPFYGQKNIAIGLYSYGHRNAQGMIWHPEREEVWIHEHGPRGGDEINILEASANYGWPDVTYGIDYSGAIISNREEHEPDYKAPIQVWDPSIAPSGMAYYDGNGFAQWQGDIFVGALAMTHLQRVRFNDDLQVVETEKLLDDWGERIRDVTIGSEGGLYILTDSGDGRLYRLVPAQ